MGNELEGMLFSIYITLVDKIREVPSASGRGTCSRLRQIPVVCIYYWVFWIRVHITLEGDVPEKLAVWRWAQGRWQRKAKQKECVIYFSCMLCCSRTGEDWRIMMTISVTPTFGSCCWGLMGAGSPTTVVSFPTLWSSMEMVKCWGSVSVQRFHDPGVLRDSIKGFSDRGDLWAAQKWRCGYRLVVNAMHLFYSKEQLKSSFSCLIGAF